MEMLNNTHKNAEIYEKISKEMSVLGYQRDLIRCRTKVKHLKTEYKKYKDALGRSGADRERVLSILMKWMFFLVINLRLQDFLSLSTRRHQTKKINLRKHVKKKVGINIFDRSKLLDIDPHLWPLLKKR